MDSTGCQKKNDATFYLILQRQLVCIKHKLYEKSISFKNQQLKQPHHQRCLNGYHGNKYADFYDFKLISAKYLL